MQDLVNEGKDKSQKAESNKGDEPTISQAQLDEAMKSVTDFSEFSKPSFSGKGFRVDLTNEDGAGYVGTIFLGSNETPARVLFDTGSDFLAVTSDLCLNATLGKQEDDVPVFDSKTMTYKPSGKDLRKCKSTAYVTKESESSKKMGGDDEKLDYGSAKLQG